MTTYDEIVETSEPHRTEAVVSTNSAQEIAETCRVQKPHSKDLLVSTKPPPLNDAVSNKSAVAEKAHHHSMEYTAGIEKEGWIVGDITYKQTKDSSTTIMKVHCETVNR